MIIKINIIISMLLLFIGCYNDNNFDYVNALENDISELKSRILDLEIENLRMNSKLDKYEKVVIDATSSNGFQPLHTSSGVFLFALRDAKPHLNGHKIIFDIGNLNNGTYNGFKINVRWGKRYTMGELLDKYPELNYSNVYEKWYNDLYEREFSLMNDLLPGSWNNIELNLTPSKPDELDYVEIKLQTNVISLRRSR
jgi:hypothetical protein